MKNDNKIAKRRILPKARPLMPEADKQEEEITRRFNPGAALPKPDEDDPDILEARHALHIAEEKLKSVVTQKTVLKLQKSGHNYDPSQVEALCTAEPWKAGELTDLSKDAFGFVPEKFEMLAQTHSLESAEYKELMEARDKAREIYRNQIMQDVAKATRHLDKPGMDPVQRRLGYEDIATKIWHFYKRANLEGDPIYKFQGARLLWSVEAGLRRCFEQNGATPNGGGQGYQKWAIKPFIPEEQDNAKIEPPSAP